MHSGFLNNQKKDLKQALVTVIYDTVLQNPPGIYFSKQGAVCWEVLPLFQTGSFRAILPLPKAQNSFKADIKNLIEVLPSAFRNKIQFETIPHSSFCKLTAQENTIINL